MRRETLPRTPRRGADRLFLVLAVLLSILLAIAVAWVEYLPTNDGPQHIFAAYLHSHLDDPGQGWNRYLDLGTHVTGSGFVPLLGLLDRILPWRTAFRVAITALALLWAWSVLALAASVGARRRWLGLLGFAAALQWQFYMGLFSCYLATAVGFLVLAAAFRFGIERRRPLLLIAMLLTFEAMAHVVAAALTSAVLLLHAGTASPSGSRTRALLRVLLTCLPVALLAGIALVLAGDSERLSQYSTSPPASQRVALLARAFVSGPFWRAWPVTLLALGAGSLAWARWRAHAADARLRTLLLAGAAALVLALATPLHIKGWEFFSVRFTPFAIVFLVLLAPPPKAGATAAIVAFSIASMAWGLAHNRFLHREHADILAGLAAPVHRVGPRLPIVLEPPPGEAADEWQRTIPFVGTNWHMGPLFALAQGGVPAYLFAGVGAIHVLGFRAPPEGSAMPAQPARGYEWRLWEPAARRDPAMRERALASLLGFAPAYEDVIFWGTAADHDVLRSRGFQSDFERGGLMLARFVGCPARLRIEPPAQGLPPTLVLAGWWPDGRPTFSTTLVSRTASDPVEVSLAASPCGAIWIRVLFDMDGNGSKSPGDRTCQGADGHAVLRQDLAPGQDLVLCAASAPMP